MQDSVFHQQPKWFSVREGGHGIDAHSCVISKCSERLLSHPVMTVHKLKTQMLTLMGKGVRAALPFNHSSLNELWQGVCQHFCC